MNVFCLGSSGPVREQTSKAKCRGPLGGDLCEACRVAQACARRESLQHCLYREQPRCPSRGKWVDDLWPVSYNETLCYIQTGCAKSVYMNTNNSQNHKLQTEKYSEIALCKFLFVLF